jgi:hypothetical protein
MAALDRPSFVAGYTAAMADLNDGSTFFEFMDRWTAMQSDPDRGAESHLDGSGWLAETVALMATAREREAKEYRRRQPGPGQRPGTIYVIRDYVRNRYKIGWTTQHVERRRRQLEQAACCQLELVATTSGTQRDERAVHERLQHSRIQGQWFANTSDVCEWIGAIS